MVAPARWTRTDVHTFLTESYRGDVTLAQLVAKARRRFPDRTPSREARAETVGAEVDRYLAPFVLDVLRITAPSFLDALLTVATSRGLLANVTRP